MSSINIGKPGGLPDSYAKSGGYSLCIERSNHNDGGCSDSKFIESTWSKSSTINYDLKNNCNNGYKLKMWLWADESSKKNENSVYVLSNAGKGNEIKDGYAIIPKSKLTGGTLTMNFSFRKVNGDILISGNPDEVDIEVIPIIMGEDGKMIGSNTSSSTTTKSNSSSSGTFNFTCDTKDSSSSGGNTSPGVSDDNKNSSGSPTGSIVALHSPPTKIPSDYPVLVVYVGSGCPPCNTEKTYLNGIMSQLKGKMHVYTVDGGHSYSTPTNIFYKNGQQSGSPIVGFDQFDQNAINSRIQSLIK